MATIPLCKLCKHRHWTYQPHVLPPTATEPSCDVAGLSVFAGLKEPLTPMLESVTQPLESVTHGGVRQGSGRKRLYASDAERKRASRARGRGVDGG